MHKRISTKKILKVILLGGILVVGLFIFILYITVKTKSTSLNNTAPFKELIGRPLTLNTTTWLIQVTPTRNKDFPYVLIDEGHENFQWFKDRMKSTPPEVVFVDSVPAGAGVIFEKATNYTNGVSGFSVACLFGTLTYHGKEYAIEYTWGKESISRRMEGRSNTWTFGWAPWQSKRDTHYYAIPDAQWW